MLVLAGLAASFLVLNSGKGAGALQVYILRPVVWVLLAYAVYRLPRQRPAGNMRACKAMIGVGVLTGSVQIAGSVAMGLLEGFGKSPYLLTARGITTNLWLVSTEIAGMEMSRAWLVNRFAGRRRPILALPIALAYAALILPLNSLPQLSDKAELVRYVGRDVLPAVSQSLACCVIALVGGSVPAMAYRSTLSLFWWFSPILPSLSWEMTALVNTVVPVIGVFLAHSEYGATVHLRKARGVGKEVKNVLTVTVVGMCLVWFAAGLFPIYPSVVVTGSMQPTISPGDMIVSTKKAHGVRVGDVIEFRHDNAWIVHRVIHIERAGDLSFYTTKGDANPTSDKDPVSSQMVRGKVLVVVPRVGQFSLAIKGLIQR